jgi:hypothetical protein
MERLWEKAFPMQSVRDTENASEGWVVWYNKAFQNINRNVRVMVTHKMYIIWRHLFVATSRHESTDSAGKQREELTVLEVSDIVKYYTPLLCTNKDIGCGTRWRSLLRQCATSRKVAGLNPYGVIEIFHWFWPFYRSMGLGSTQRLTGMNTRDISWWVKATGG